MVDKIKEIARRIKDLREILEITREEMAAYCGMGLEEYGVFEAGGADFTFTFIYKCAQRFGVDISDLLVGSSPRLTAYSVVRKGDGLPIARRKGFSYQNLAPLFKGKLAEPFIVTAPYSEDEQNREILASSHEGQEINYILKGRLKVRLDGHTEILNEGDLLYYDSSTPHGMIATGGENCEFISVVIHKGGMAYQYPQAGEPAASAKKRDAGTNAQGGVYETFADLTEDSEGRLLEISFKNEDKFNFAYDVLDVLAEKYPRKLAMLHVSREKEERRFTYAELSKASSKAANYLKSLGIKKGDRVMLVLKRHYQFWILINALHKIGAIAVPATNLLVQKDFEYRFNAAQISAVICTPDGDTAHQVELAQEKSPTLKTRIMVTAPRDGWRFFDGEYQSFPDAFPRPEGEENPQGEDIMLMYFTSGTTGYPKIAQHSFTYPLGHLITAKYWQNVKPDGLHLTIAETGWGKALWGKLYGQWLCEAAVFVYDFDRFDAQDLLAMFGQYQITTFCAPPTMYRFFIKEDLSQYDLSSLEYATIAGEALNPEVYQQFLKATGVRLMEGFGQTETTLVVANLWGTECKPGSMGKPSPLFDVDLIDGDGKTAADGEVGEIVIRTDKTIPCGLFDGYFKDEARTKETWRNNVYHTGDTAWRDEDGYFWYVGRLDDLIKSSGYRIGPFEIESVIMELPYVLECAVTGAPDPLRGQIVKATIVLTKGTQACDELKKEIQSYVKSHTAPYKYPRIIEFVAELPKTISGKIKRVDLRNQGK